MVEEKKTEYDQMSEILRWELIKFHARETLLGWQVKLSPESYLV